jgi:hypothetical protein
MSIAVTRNARTYDESLDVSPGKNDSRPGTGDRQQPAATVYTVSQNLYLLLNLPHSNTEISKASIHKQLCRQFMTALP